MPKTAKPPKPKKYEKPISLSDVGTDFESVVSVILKAPPMPKKKKKPTKRKVK